MTSLIAVSSPSCGGATVAPTARWRQKRTRRVPWISTLLLCALAVWVVIAFWMQFVRPGVLAMHAWPDSGASVWQLERAWAPLRASLAGDAQQTLVYVADAACVCNRKSPVGLDALGLRAAERQQRLVTLTAAELGVAMPPGVDLLVFSPEGRLRLATRAGSGAVCGSPLLALERAINLSLSADVSNAAAPLYLPETCACR